MYIIPTAPPRFVTVPEEVTYVNIGDSIILSCVAEATPKAEMVWFRDNAPVKSSDTVGIFNDGTELRINKIRDEDIGDYLCVARNNEGRVVHEAKVVTAGMLIVNYCVIKFDSDKDTLLTSMHLIYKCKNYMVL